MLARRGYATPHHIAEITELLGEYPSKDYCKRHHIRGLIFELGTTRPKKDTPGTFQTPGIPDLAIYDFDLLQTIWIELKVPPNGLTPEQKVCHAYGMSYVAKSARDVMAILELTRK